LQEVEEGEPLSVQQSPLMLLLHQMEAIHSKMEVEPMVTVVIMGEKMALQPAAADFSQMEKMVTTGRLNLLGENHL
tara:strand:- start:212 stop:439 length:228 start_codon:yes stop_codon:yes gene_type:complete